MAGLSDVITVEHLHKRYGDKVAVDDVSFSVRSNEIFGIIGPNGAGKTTTVESLIGLRDPDRGVVSVLGMDPKRDGLRLRDRLGVQLQEAALPDRMTPRDAFRLYAALYARTVPWMPLARQWGIAEKLSTPFGKLSGGQKQRLFVALALLNDPDIVILDELSAGLDPQARRNSWQLVRDIRDAGKTVLLVSHFMDEAEALCDRIAVIDAGRVVALDTPANLSHGVGSVPAVAFTAPERFDPVVLGGRAGIGDVRREGPTVLVTGGEYVMADVAVALRDLGLAPPDLRMASASLEDVFIQLTTHGQADTTTAEVANG
ncbi:MAG TPA: ABC transporter ATP-binding protein [Thermomicrobiales bacterium]|jgi:ABC-2 type transport system ATP-binding protein|nr:ABC transporter ATP-binding protein [Thermomicrobiales bacterium]